MLDTLSVIRSAGGIGVYVRELVRYASHDPRWSLTLICSRSNRDRFDALGISGLRIVEVPWSTESRAVRVLTQQLLLPWVAWRHRPDVLFAPVDVAPLAAPVPVVCCVHSSHLNRLHGYGDGLLQSLYNRLFMRGTLRRARQIIVISDYVRRETARMFGLDTEAMQVVYHGGGLVEQARKSGWRPPADDSRRGGILFVGSLYPHKRADALIRAYGQLCADWNGPDLPHLCFVGKDPKGALARLEQIAVEERVADRVHFRGRLSDEALLELIASSRLLVMPSEVEGFGLPIVEAMQAGLPVVTSTHSCLPEIAGSAALCVDPDDREAFAAAMRRALLEPELRARMIERGFERGAAFSWERTARETIEVLSRIARKTAS